MQFRVFACIIEPIVLPFEADMDENAVPAIIAETFAVMIDRLVKDGWIRENEIGLESEIG